MPLYLTTIQNVTTRNTITPHVLTNFLPLYQWKRKHWWREIPVGTNKFKMIDHNEKFTCHRSGGCDNPPQTMNHSLTIGRAPLSLLPRQDLAQYQGPLSASTVRTIERIIIYHHSNHPGLANQRPMFTPTSKENNPNTLPKRGRP